MEELETAPSVAQSRVKHDNAANDLEFLIHGLFRPKIQADFAMAPNNPYYEPK